MANLVSPGVSVTITDESFFIPAAASTVPLIFVATADEKKQPNGLEAAGTFEHDVVRTVTSLKQSLELYGVPKFLQDSAGNQHHGDARNEYGLFALNQFLGIGNLSYVVRANVNLDDDLTNIRALWDGKFSQASTVLDTLINNFLTEYNTTNGYVPSNPNYKVTVGESELLSLIQEATVDIWAAFSFKNTKNDFFDNNLLPGLATSGIQVVNFNGAINKGSQTVNMGGVITASGTTGLSNNASNYSASVLINGITTVNLVITGSSAQTFQSLVNAMNSVLGVNAIASIENGNIKITSTSVTGTSAVAITDTDLFNSLTGYVALLSPVAGVANPSGLANDATVYSAIISVDGNLRPISVVGSAAQTFSTVISEIQTDLGALATIVLDNGNLKITSASTGATSIISTQDGNLFTTLKNFVNLQVPVNGLPGDAVLNVYSNGYNYPPDPNGYLGLEGILSEWVTMGSGGTIATEWTVQEATNTLIQAADLFKFTAEFQAETSLGANDTARRVAITTALQATVNGNTELRSENYEYNLILCPGFPELVDEMLALVADISDEAFVIADTPMNMDPTQVVAWSNTVGKQTSINVAYYYPHSLASNLDGVNVLAAASGTALRTFTYSDDVSDLWIAPAGTRRGLVTGVTDVGYASGNLGGPTTFAETHLNQGQRDDLYKYFTNINPITFFPGRGILVWGQKTAAPDASALDRVNVSRLVKYIKRQLRKNTMAFVFEPNDQLTRDNLKSVVDGFLGDLIVKRGLYDFATLCSEANNTPDVIDRNELRLDVAIKPVKAAEFISIPIRVVNTGTSI